MIPTKMPHSIIPSNTITMHMPRPNTKVATRPYKVFNTIFALGNLIFTPDCLQCTSKVTNNTTAPTAVKTTLEGVRGIVVSELTADAMAKEIQRLVMQGDMKLSISEMEGIVNQYSCDEMAKKYCDVYQTLLKRK